MASATCDSHLALTYDLPGAAEIMQGILGGVCIAREARYDGRKSAQQKIIVLLMMV